jgi:hypothetical protein
VVFDQPGHLDPVGGHRAEAHGLAEDGQHEPHVVGLAVVEQVAAARLAGGQGREQLEHLGTVDHAVAGRAPVVLVAPAAAGHHVVHVQTDAGEPVGPRTVERGDDQRQRLHEMRGERDVDLPLDQRLAHQPEVEVLQVAQAAVDELGRPRRGADRVVGALHERDRVAPGGGVERDARAGDAPADHEDVERLGGKCGDGVGPGEHLPIRH